MSVRPTGPCGSCKHPSPHLAACGCMSHSGPVQCFGCEWCRPVLLKFICRKFTWRHKRLIKSLARKAGLLHWEALYEVIEDPFYQTVDKKYDKKGVFKGYYDSSHHTCFVEDHPQELQYFAWSNRNLDDTITT